ncbi:hypothetical protein LTR95_006593 [Oleoguttula sp. CCFEE 5521]
MYRSKMCVAEWTVILHASEDPAKSDADQDGQVIHAQRIALEALLASAVSNHVPVVAVNGFDSLTFVPGEVVDVEEATIPISYTELPRKGIHVKPPLSI